MEETTDLTKANDTHTEFWREIEKDVQARALLKDPTFRLNGPWKKLIRVDEEGFKIFKVDVFWVRRNLNVTFGHGGHGFVYEFIPLDEIWSSSIHSLCICTNVEEGQPVSDEFFDSCTLHEITEFKEMKAGLEYWEAHQISLQAELDAGFLKDPYAENE